MSKGDEELIEVTTEREREEGDRESTEEGVTKGSDKEEETRVG